MAEFFDVNDFLTDIGSGDSKITVNKAVALANAKLEYAFEKLVRDALKSTDKPSQSGFQPLSKTEK